MARSEDLTRLYIRQSGHLGRILRRMTGNREAAEDIAQDAYIKLSAHEIGENDVGLLVRTAQNLARDSLRAERVRSAYAACVRPEQTTPSSAMPDDAAAARQDLRDLMAALTTLPERVQRVFLLSRLDEVPYTRIAKMLGVSVSTVEKDMVVALEFCRRWRKQRDLF